jgi:hypothetical protein
MPEYAVYFSRRYTFRVEAADSEEAFNKALEDFDEGEADAATDWEADEYIDRL